MTHDTAAQNYKVKQSPSVLISRSLKSFDFEKQEAYLSVAALGLGADGEAEASAARDVRYHQEVQPLVPAWTAGLHHLAALGLT